jgi:hypothetical protein
MIAHRPFIKAGTVAIALVLAAVALSACTDARRALGYDKAPPDEFAVIARAPLAQPPDYNLRPPAPGAPRPQEGTPTDQARAALTPGKNAPLAAPNGTKGEQVMLAKAGADKSTPDIRRVVNEETTQMVEADDHFVDHLMFWQDKAPPGDIVSPGPESKRLKDNAAAGKPATEGQTVIIERKSSAWWDNLF